jgi:uncharacterized protein YuzE
MGKAKAIRYDGEEDILIIHFSENRPCATFDLAENLFARVDPETNEVVSLEIMGFLKDLKMKTPAHLPKEFISS